MNEVDSFQLLMKESVTKIIAIIRIFYGSVTEAQRRRVFEDNSKIGFVNAPYKI